jgi:leader peptidase (prepilin peptidase)/N-methyltransferase
MTVHDVDVTFGPNAIGTAPPVASWWVAALAVQAGAVVWTVTGAVVAAPVVAVGVMSWAGGVLDARTGRIPNRLISVAAAMFLAGAALLAVVDGRSVGEITGAAVAGVVFSGAPFLALLWLVRPSSFGGGDLKLIIVLGATIGLLAPYAGAIILMVAWLVALVQGAGQGPRHVRFGLGFALGCTVAAAAGAAWSSLLGGTE